MTKMPSGPPRANRQATGGSKAGVFDPANLAAPAEAAKTCEKNFVGAPNGARDDIKRIQKTIALLAERWPRCFFLHPPHRRPLKIRIDQDIAAAAPDIEPTLLGRTLGYYVNGIAYLDNCRPGAARIDLNGEVCGSVSPEDAERATRRYAAALKRSAARRRAVEVVASAPTSPAAPSTSPSTSPAPKRLGLADLKRLALERKQGTSP
jgi:ProP effector